jgi:hypothetical protein
LEYILRELLSHYAQRRRLSRSKNTVTLGFPVRFLTGPAARGIVASAVARDYPNCENEKIFRSHLQALMADITKPMQLAPGDLDVQLRQYQARLRQRHERFKQTQQKFSRRPWRNNPWR